MSVIAVVLDAANIACKNRRNGEPPQWHFSRVERVRAACLATWPGAHVRAVIDASAEQRLIDRRRSEVAHAEGWLYTASGDADDRVLEMAATLGAPVVSRDNFYDARRNHPWLEGDERVWSFSIQKDRSVVLRPRRLQPASDEQVAGARRKKARKAGVISMGLDEVWLCTAPSKRECKYAGQPVQVIQTGSRRVCRFCSYPAEEQIYTPATVPVLVLHIDGQERGRFTLSSEGLVLGRGGQTRPEVTDIAVELDTDAARRIGRRHLHVEPDDEGWPIVVHQSSQSKTFLNPRVGADGLPLDNVLYQGEPYPLIEGDTLWLDEGRVRLTVTAEEP
jgi:hypothetical protein